MKKRWLTTVALGIALPVLLHSQSPPAQKPADPSPQATFRAGVELVRLDVRVIDGQGLPVNDLKPEEVQVFEGNEPRPVALFQRVEAPQGTYLEVARRTIGAEVSTNQGAPRGHLYIFVFDQAHIAPNNEVRARGAVEKFLRTRVKPGDRVALYALPGPGPQIPFTSNVNIAVAELPKVRGMLERQRTSPTGTLSDYEAYEIVRGNDMMLQRALARAAVGDLSGSSAAARVVGTTIDSSPMAIEVAKSSAKSIVDRADSDTRSFLLNLSDVIRELAAIEGRKSVILVSEGFFTDNVAPDIDRVAASAAEAYAVIYSLDINRRGGGDLNAEAPTGPDPFNEIQSRIASLGTLAAETSGQLVLDASGRGEEVLNRIADASQDYYVIGFEPPAAALGDRARYRRVSIKVTRPGARVETRTGYALGNAANPPDRRRAIDVALGAPFPQQGLPLEMTTYVLRGSSVGAQRVIMSLQAELPVAADGAAKAADVVFVARDARDGRVRASGSDTMPLPRALAPGRRTAQGQFRVQFELPAGHYLMRAAVREPGGATGTVDRRFEVRALDGADITASDLIIGRRSDALPVRARSYREEGINGALEVYARTAADLEAADVTVDLVPVNAEQAVRSVKADLGDVRPIGTGTGRQALVSVPLDGVRPGDYVARARVRARGETIAEILRQVEVVDGTPPAEAPPAPAARVTPRMILGGELSRRFVTATAKSVAEPALKAAAAQAEGGHWESVSTQLERVPAAATKGADYLVLLGLAQFAAEQYDPAAASLQSAFTLSPTSAPTAFLLGWVHSNAGRPQEALTAWRNAIRLDATMTSAYLALAETYLQLSHPELAVQVLKEGLKAQPTSLELQNKLAVVERR